MARSTVEVVCEQCGAIFTRNRVSTLTYRFCSTTCAGAAKRTSVVRTCNHCGGEFTTRPSELAKGKGLYCSKSCYAASITTLTTLACEQCGGPFETNPSRIKNGARFCSLSCYNKSREIRRRCRQCDKRLSKDQKIFCSRACLGRAEMQRREREKSDKRRLLAKLNNVANDPGATQGERDNARRFADRLTERMIHAA